MACFVGHAAARAKIVFLVTANELTREGIPTQSNERELDEVGWVVRHDLHIHSHLRGGLMTVLLMG